MDESYMCTEQIKLYGVSVGDTGLPFHIPKQLKLFVPYEHIKWNVKWKKAIPDDLEVKHPFYFLWVFTPQDFRTQWKYRKL